jgi:bifunctional DNase/RNase
VSDHPAGQVAAPDPAAPEHPATSVPPAPEVAPVVGPVVPSSAGPQPVGPPDPPVDDSAQPGETAEPVPLDGAEKAEAVPEPETLQFSMALVSAVTVDLPNQHPTVVLRESESPRRQLSFSIGLPDAVVLSHAMRRIPTPRPLTPELLTSILQGFDIDVVAVRLVGRQGSVYFAELDLQGRSGRSVHSCRPSDALTVALLQPVPVPILIDRRLLALDGDVPPPGPAPST